MGYNITYVIVICQMFLNEFLIPNWNKFRKLIEENANNFERSIFERDYESEMCMKTKFEVD